MITFEEALNIVLSRTLAVNTEVVPLEDSIGRVLAQSVTSDIDMPPFNKSAVDGYAYRSSDHGKQLKICETIRAGSSPGAVISEGLCSKIMTGAKVPEGADSIVMVEDVDVQGDYILFKTGGIDSAGNPKGKNICPQGEDIKKGVMLLEKGSLIRAAEVAILASAGVSAPMVATRIKTGIICTGEELVEPGETPSQVQIRNSNGWQLRAQVSSAGSEVSYYGIVPDNFEALKKTVKKAASENDIIIMTGGVSMGDFDFVPEVISQVGFYILFDRVAVQPGKPSTFAVYGDGIENRKVLFALPGNPVSSLVQFELLVKPFIYRSMGNNYSTLWFSAISAMKYERRSAGRKGLVPAVLSPDDRVTFLEYHGSAHIASLARANAIAEIPIGCKTIDESAPVRIFLLK